MTSSIQEEHLRPPLKLLGGSGATGKPSKLAALAAARKKKENDKTGAPQATQSDSKPTQSSAVSLLDRLGTKDVPNTAPVAPSESAIEARALPRSYPVRKRRSPSPPIKVQAPPSQDEASEDQDKEMKLVRSGASIFAQILCGKSNTTRRPSSASSPDALATLYGSVDHILDANPFAGPSPDDIVAQAQSKGLHKA